jgi:hypothetical protein
LWTFAEYSAFVWKKSIENSYILSVEYNVLIYLVYLIFPVKKVFQQSHQRQLSKVMVILNGDSSDCGDNKNNDNHNMIMVKTMLVVKMTILK